MSTPKLNTDNQVKKPDEESDSLMAIRDYGEEQFDKLIIFLNSGALVFSIGFVEKILTTDNPEFTYLLFCSWLAFGLALAVNLYTHRLTARMIDYSIKKEDKRSDTLNFWIHGLNEGSYWLFALGTISFIIFGILNF